MKITNWAWILNIKEKYNHLFLIAIILINFLHKCPLNFTYEIINNQIDDSNDYNWDKDF
jgi:hypothetical protein